MNVSLISRADVCPLCGAAPCAKACPTAAYAPVVLQTSCGWCGARMVEGALDAEGRESTGMCAACLAEQRARIKAKAKP